VHLNEPGRTDWEGFLTGTRAAASGGVTTLVDMPLNSLPPTTTVASLESKRMAAKGVVWTDVSFWGGVIPGNEVAWDSFLGAACQQNIVPTATSETTRGSWCQRFQMLSHRKRGGGQWYHC
jgi:dihydroorotase-like cyclic amidohydrolase